MSILVFAEHDGKEVKTPSLHAITAAKSLGKITLLLIGSGAKTAAESAKNIPGVGEILVAESEKYNNLLAEQVAPLLVSLAASCSHIFAAATSVGKNIFPRTAALLDVQQISEISAVKSADTFIRPIYAGNALATVQSRDKVKLITVRMAAFEASPRTGGDGTAAIKSIDAVAGHDDLAKFVSSALSHSERPELTSARIVISGGRGMQNGENFKLLDAVADKLGAAVGASRAAVDSGYVPNEFQVGQTGKVIAPDLYIAVGISGAIQHLAGMKDSKVIACINKDADAPIFQVADYGLVADLFEAVPQFSAALDGVLKK
ncbi:MAG: FAD-binding protein [Candidatus Symbiobacter sp.]|nr:FAD-binding protein [Candidatus Symbiobacter sp.]